MYSISIYFEEPGIPPVCFKNIRAGTTLLELCVSNGLALRHQCGGACTCGTCHIYVNEGEPFLEPLSKRELDVMRRYVQQGPGSRLACQCVLQPGTGSVSFTIPNGQQ